MKSELLSHITRLEKKLSAARAFLASLDDDDAPVPKTPVPQPVPARRRMLVEPSDTAYGQNVSAVLAAIPPFPAIWTVDEILTKLSYPLDRKQVIESVNGLVKRNTIRRIERGNPSRPAKFQKAAA